MVTVGGTLLSVADVVVCGRGRCRLCIALVCRGRIVVPRPPGCGPLLSMKDDNI